MTIKKQIQRLKKYFEILFSFGFYPQVHIHYNQQPVDFCLLLLLPFGVSLIEQHDVVHDCIQQYRASGYQVIVEQSKEEIPPEYTLLGIVLHGEKELSRAYWKLQVECVEKTSLLFQKIDYLSS